jgi:hypothetical protein
MAKTIADLGRSQEVKPVVGKSMIDDGHKPINERIRELVEKGTLESELLEAGGYDYGGNEQWGRAMRNVGRR